MFAFVSNEYQGIVYSKEHAKILSGIYSNPKVQYCRTAEECRDFIKRNPRYVYDAGKKYGWKKNTAYIRVEYFISDETIYANLYTDHFGFVYLNIKSTNMIQSVTYDLIKLKIMNVNVHDESITSHCIAVKSIINVLNPIINVQVIVPDVSVFLALTEYSGPNSTITDIQKNIEARIGKVALLLK